MTVLIAAAQLNQTVGDFDGNARRIIDAAGGNAFALRGTRSRSSVDLARLPKKPPSLQMLLLPGP